MGGDSRFIVTFCENAQKALQIPKNLKQFPKNGPCVTGCVSTIIGSASPPLEDKD